MAKEHADPLALPILVSSYNNYLFSNIMFIWDEGNFNLYVRGFDTTDVQEISVAVHYMYNYMDLNYNPVANATFNVDPCCINYVAASFEIQNQTLVVGENGQVVLPTLIRDNSNGLCSYEVLNSLLDQNFLPVDEAVQATFTTHGFNTILTTRVDEPTFAD